MNRVYRLIGNAGQDVWVVASELVKGHKKREARLLSVVVWTSLVASTALAAPGTHDIPQLSGISSGSATLTANVDRGLLTINQSTDKLIANWNSFDVGSAARVYFKQLDSNSIALNRINAAAPSEIFGKVSANGQLILLNPAGLVFGAGSQVNAASLIASTFQLSDANFNDDKLLFERNESTATVNNQGGILARQGDVLLLANSIKNSGVIRAKNGNIRLVNANSALVTAQNVAVQQPGNVAGLIQQSGVLTATRVESQKGRIQLLGNSSREGSSVLLSGEINGKSSLIRGRQIYIADALSTTGNVLLDSVKSVYISAPVDVLSSNRLVSVVHGQKAGEGVHFSANGQINLLGSNLKYRQNGQYYQVIKNIDELQAVGADTAALAGKYVLGQSFEAFTGDWNNGKGFNPIGTTANPFIGTLDGLGHTISHLYINRLNEYRVGLFGVAQNSMLKNITLKDAYIVGYDTVGGLVGENRSTVGKHSYIENNTVAADTFIYGEFDAEVACISFECESGETDWDGYWFYGGKNIGGLIGLNQVGGNTVMVGNSVNVELYGNSNVGGLIGGQVTGNLASSTVQGNRSQGNIQGNSGVGGLIGGSANDKGHSLIMQNYAGTAIGGTFFQSPDYAGGLVGAINVTNGGITTIKNNYASGNVGNGCCNGNNVLGDSYLGGLLGQVDSNAGQVNIALNYATGNVMGRYQLGGLIGYNWARNGGSININNVYASGKVYSDTNSVNIGGLVGLNESNRYGGLQGSIKLSNSYWDSDTTQQGKAVGGANAARFGSVFAVSGAGGGYPNAFDAVSYGKFDFVEKWYIAEGSRPLLHAFLDVE